jgi:signal transduction histidine kinase
MQRGTDRIRSIVLSLRNFSRLDEAEIKQVDLHEGIENTLLILQHRLKAKGQNPEIQVLKEYGNLPTVECYPGQLNQVFMNILTNAIEAFERSRGGTQECPSPSITIRTSLLESSDSTQNAQNVLIQIADNGPGMTESVKARIFDPFFSTKPVGEGTGLGLAISYQVVVKHHHGILTCTSAPGRGTEFLIEIPIRQNN